MKWRGGNRRLTIIDEALANVVENNKVTLTDLAQALSYIQLDLQRAFPEQIKVLEELHAVLVSNADPACPDHHTARMLWDDSHPIQIPDMAALSSAMKLLRYDELVLNEHNDSSRTKIARKVSETIASAAAVTTQWAYYAQRGTEHSINASSFLIPWDVPGPVVLDATANANFLWDLLGTRSQTIPTPPKARNYENVTLHVARASGLGKHSMIKASKARLPRLLAALEKELGSERSVFLCMHKATEHLAHTYAPRFKEFDVGHWGAVDGRNTWQDYDTAVIFGLAHPNEQQANR